MKKRSRATNYDINIVECFSNYIFNLKNSLMVGDASFLLFLAELIFGAIVSHEKRDFFNKKIDKQKKSENYIY